MVLPARFGPLETPSIDSGEISDHSKRQQDLMVDLVLNGILRQYLDANAEDIYSTVLGYSGNLVNLNSFTVQQ